KHPLCPRRGSWRRSGWLKRLTPEVSSLSVTAASWVRLVTFAFSSMQCPLPTSRRRKKSSFLSVSASILSASLRATAFAAVELLKPRWLLLPSIRKFFVLPPVKAETFIFSRAPSNQRNYDTPSIEVSTLFKVQRSRFKVSPP